MNVRLVAALCLGFTLIFSGLAVAETVKIGVIGTYSGPYARWGQQFKQAIEIYQKQRGATLNGNAIEIIYRDDQGPSPDRAKQLVNELIQIDKVSFIAGFPWSPNAIAIAPNITEAKMPTVLFNAPASIITRQSPYFVRTSFTLPQLAAPVGAWGAKSGNKTAMTVVADFPAGIDAEVYFSKAFRANGGEILGSTRTPLSTTDFKAAFEEVKQRKPDALFISGPTGPGSIGMVRAWAEMLKPLGIKLLATNEITELYLPDYGKDAVGIVSAVHYTESNDSSLNKDLRAQLAAAFGPSALPDVASVATYDGMHLIYQAIAKLGARPEADQVMKLAAGMSFDSPRGSKILIDPKERDIVQDIDIRRVEERGGKLVNVVIDKVPMVKDLWKEDNPPK